MDHHLLTYITVVEKQNFTRAAESLHITQAAVTQVIKSLEKQYGVQLLNRTNKYVRMTKAGELLYQHAKEIIAQYEHLDRVLEDLTHSASGPLMIGSSFSFGEYLLPGLISEFKKLYPLITPTISIRNSERILLQLEQHELDIAIIEGEVEHSNLRIQPFAQDEMVVIVPSSHRLSHRKKIELEELSEETWIIREEGSGTRQTIDALFSKTNFTPQSLMSFGSSQVIKESVEAGLGISIMSLCTLRKELLLRSIVPLRIKHYPIMRNYSYATHKTKLNIKSLSLFINFLESYSKKDLLDFSLESKDR